MGLVETLKTDAEQRGLVCYINIGDDSDVYDDSRVLMITGRNHGLKIGDRETRGITERLLPFVQRYGRRIEYMIIEAVETAEWGFEELAKYGDFKLQGVIPFLKDELYIKAIGDKEELDEQKRLEEKLSDLTKEILKGKYGFRVGYSCKEFKNVYNELNQIYVNREGILSQEAEKSYHSTETGIIWLDTGGFHVPRLTAQAAIPCIGILTPELKEKNNAHANHKQSCLEAVERY